MSAELLATYSSLGTQDGDNYYRGEDCLGKFNVAIGLTLPNVLF